MSDLLFYRNGKVFSVPYGNILMMASVEDDIDGLGIEHWTSNIDVWGDSTGAQYVDRN